MRRWSTAFALAGVVGLLVTSCGGPAGTDGRLLDDWAPMAEPRPFVPTTGACHGAAFAETVDLGSDDPVDCGASHRLETVYVGTFTDAAGARGTPPPAGAPERRAAFAECDRNASGYVGAQWRDGRLQLGVATPSDRAWQAGARWFRCDLAEVSNVEENGAVVTRTSSLRDALKAPSPLGLACYTAKLTAVRTIGSMPPADCGRGHNAEYVGVWRAPEPLARPSTDRDWLPFYDGCRSQIARYVGVPDDATLRYRAGVRAVPAGVEQWRAGDRGVRCYLWFTDRTLARSLRNAGLAALPIESR